MSAYEGEVRYLSSFQEVTKLDGEMLWQIGKKKVPQGDRKRQVESFIKQLIDKRTETQFFHIASPAASPTSSLHGDDLVDALFCSEDVLGDGLAHNERHVCCLHSCASSKLMQSPRWSGHLLLGELVDQYPTI